MSFRDKEIAGGRLRGLLALLARPVALAERFGFLQGFQPTMSADQARRDAEQADRSAYADAVSGYADLDHTALRATALAAIKERG